jgi:acetyl esterase/lipase
VTVPVGYVWSVAVVALGTFLALKPARHPWPLGTLSFFFGVVVNELPFVAFYWLLASTLLALAQGDLVSPGGLAALVVAALTTTGLAAVVWRGLQAGPAIEQAIGRELGIGRCQASDRPAHLRLPSGRSLARFLLTPFPLWRRDVERIANVSYGDAGRANRLDLYRHRSHPAGAPVLIHLHGGHFRMGAKSREARAIFHRLAGQGWVCASANYRLREAGRFPNSLIDAKKAIAWARRHAPDYDADPTVLVVAGSSAGAHLASMAALTPNEPAFQPGFAHEDTSVSAAVCLYGYYGNRDFNGPLASSPLAYAHADAPPFFVAHGTNDTATSVEAAANFAEQLRGISASPVVYAQLPGAGHVFDMFRSLRLERVINGIEVFAAWVRDSRRTPRSSRPTDPIRRG